MPKKVFIISPSSKESRQGEEGFFRPSLLSDVGLAVVSCEVKKTLEALGLNVFVNGSKEYNGIADVLIEIREGRSGQRTSPADIDIKGSLFFVQAYTFNYPLVKNAVRDIINKGGLAVVGGVDTFVRKEEIVRELGEFGCSVVLGETALTDVLKEVISDYISRKSLRPIYEQTNRPKDLTGFPFDADIHRLLDRRAIVPLVISSLGCPVSSACAFCSKDLVSGKGVRFRPPEEVINEIMVRLKESKEDHFAFADAAIFPNSKTLLLLEMLIKMQERNILDLKGGFGVQMCTDTLLSPEIEEFLSLLSKAGCRQIVWGIESPFPDMLESIGKVSNLDRFGHSEEEIFKNSKLTVERIHKHGVSVSGLFIFDPRFSEGQTNRLLEFTDNVGFDMINVTVLTPLPGTKIFEELKHLICDKDLTHFDTCNIVFNPINKSVKEAQAIYNQLMTKLSLSERMLKRSLSTLRNTRGNTVSKLKRVFIETSWEMIGS